MGIVLPKNINRIDHHHFGNHIHIYLKEVHFFNLSLWSKWQKNARVFYSANKRLLIKDVLIPLPYKVLIPGASAGAGPTLLQSYLSLLHLHYGGLHYGGWPASVSHFRQAPHDARTPVCQRPAWPISHLGN